MNDNELIAWQVMNRDGEVEFTCLKSETAEYLRDWLIAIDVNSYKDHAKARPQYSGMFENSSNNLMSRPWYYVNECEVIVG